MEIIFHEHDQSGKEEHGAQEASAMGFVFKVKNKIKKHPDIYG